MLTTRQKAENAASNQERGPKKVINNSGPNVPRPSDWMAKPAPLKLRVTSLVTGARIRNRKLINDVQV